MTDVDLSEMQIDTMVQNSFKNFHTKGFDYLCLHRTPYMTEKIYFFEGDVAQMPEVVNPHDHRYNFETQVLTGIMSDSSYRVLTEPYSGELRGTEVVPFYEHEWRTPLNGGSGAEYLRDVYLHEFKRVMLRKREKLGTKYSNIHTIRMHTDTCVIRLVQYSDVVPVDKPSRLFMAEKQAPNLDGLYERMTVDHCLMRYNQYQELLKDIQND